MLVFFSGKSLARPCITIKVSKSAVANLLQVTLHGVNMSASCTVMGRIAFRKLMYQLKYYQAPIHYVIFTRDVVNDKQYQWMNILLDNIRFNCIVLKKGGFYRHQNAKS